MKELINAINAVVEFGLHPNIPSDDKELTLERNLVKIFSLYYDLTIESDDADYPDFEKEMFPNVRENLTSNFPLYFEVSNLIDDVCGFPSDDLPEIVYDLLEAKWRIENNSLADGLFYFQLHFYSHTQRHILRLLCYMKEKNG